jgi:hypothetical protein
LEVDLFELVLGGLNVVEEGLESVSELLSEVSQDFVMPGVVLGVDFVEDQAVVDYNGTKSLFGLTVVEGSSVLSDFVEESLPFVDVVSQFLEDLLRVDDPEGLVVVPDLYIVFSSVEDLEDLLVGILENLRIYLEEHVVVVLFPLLFLTQRTPVFVRLEARQSADNPHNAVELLTPHKLGVLQGWVQEKDVVLGFELESHFFSDEVKLDILFVSVGEVDEFLNPFLDEGF